MEGDNENLKFDCAFSEKAMKINSISLTVFAVLILAALCFIARNDGIIRQKSFWFCFAYIVIITLTYIIGKISIRRLAKGSFIELTSDGQLRCKFKGRKEVGYPIKEIRAIEESSLKDAEKKYATFPLVLNSRGEELYPPKGVLITFNRAWIKSVFPVYFNPADIESFISEIRHRMESTYFKEL